MDHIEFNVSFGNSTLFYKMRYHQTISLLYRTYVDRHPDRIGIKFYFNGKMLDMNSTIEESGLTNGCTVIASYKQEDV